LDLLACPWVENLPEREFARLKEIFKAHGRPVDPDRPDLRESIGPVNDQSKAIFRGGEYLLREMYDEDGKFTGKWLNRKIDTPEGRKVVEEWIAANYEALKCAAIALPQLAVSPVRRLLWYDDRFCVLVDLMESIPVATRYAGEEDGECVENLPSSALERLRCLFQEYGSPTAFDPKVLEGTHTWIDLAD
jgi:hypothetical protein